jgi:RHS repeat-associated protein
LYSGEQFDAKIGQQYLWQRYYDPVTGRFNRLDPFFGNLDDPQSLHKYLYTHADPVNGIDPTGLFGMDLGLGGLRLGADLNTNIQTYAIDGYQDAHDGIVHGLNIFEIKGHKGLMRGSGYGYLSLAQRNVDDFITTRLQEAANPTNIGHWSDTNVSPQVRKAAQEALDHINDKKLTVSRMIHVENVFGSVLNNSAKIIYKSWKRLKLK